MVNIISNLISLVTELLSNILWYSDSRKDRKNK